MTGYTWRTVILKNKTREKKRLVIETEEPSFNIVCDFINIEMPSYSREIMSSLEETEKTGKQTRFSGNRYSLAAGIEKALITLDTEEELLWYEMRTEELIRLLEEWQRKASEL